MTNTILLAAIGLSAIAADQPPLTLQTDQPGNLFAYGDEVKVEVAAAGAQAVAWELLDYDGKSVGSGEAKLADGRGSIPLGQLDRGYYELTVKAGEAAATTSLGVINSHSDEDPPSTRLNVDGATAWLEHEGRWSELARILRRMGIGWVRERFSWGQTEPAQGTVDYKQYDAVADAYHEQGVRVYQIFHDTPGWTHAGQRDTRNPEDLREVYNFAKRLAEHYRGKVQAWEVWNEADISFWPDLSDTFAGVQKAAYLGFKAGDPELPVLLVSFCRGVCAFDEGLFDAGIQDYSDIFNWHIYAPPSRYPSALERYLELLDRYGAETRPVWLSEAGIRLPATGADHDLTPADQHQQAEFVPLSLAESMAAGTDRHFFFVYPWYLENGIQFGSLHQDLSPSPSTVALAVAVDVLGEARYLGRLDLEGATGLGFDSGTEAVLVIAADEARTVELDVGAPQVEVVDLVGRRKTVTTGGGKVSLTIGPAAQYLVGVGDALKQRLAGPVRAPGVLPDNHPDPLVIRGQAEVEELDKGGDCYIVGTTFGYRVEVCNFGAHPASGTMRLELPAGWTATPPSADFALEPMGRQVSQFQITVGKPAQGLPSIKVVATAAGHEVAPSVSHFRLDASALKPVASLDLKLDTPAAWTSNLSGNGTMQIAAGDDGGVRFDIHFTGEGDRWSYPRATFAPPRDWSGYDGLGLEYRCNVEDAQTVVRCQFIEPSGASYLGDIGPARTEWRRVVVPFDRCGWGSWSQPDPNGKLDLNALAGMLVGVNTKRDEVRLEVRNLTAVKLWED